MGRNETQHAACCIQQPIGPRSRKSCESAHTCDERAQHICVHARRDGEVADDADEEPSGVRLPIGGVENVVSVALEEARRRNVHTLLIVLVLRHMCQ